MATLSAVDISKNYGPHHVLNGVSLSASSGDVITLVGSSGSGKSTFLRCLNLLELPTAGRLLWNGDAVALARKADGLLHPTSAKELQRFRSKLAMVFQSFNLWSHLNVLDNVTLIPRKNLGVSRDEALVRARNYLEKVHIDPEKFGHCYPIQLSGGMQQRVAIARALAVEPEIIFLDEPTSALDPELVGEVLGVIKGLAQEGRTMVMVTHEMKFAREVSTEVVFLHKGVIEERNNPEAFFSHPQSERLKAFLGRSSDEVSVLRTA
ncbi:ATP-binding cassette domain-containing protein [Pseudomonas kermanshahensis]|uniref:ATP-binding cassette domain-containing protein n=1 Tax=Pseudomonas kermanshahensis TaxID=2745482 RepID=A0ABU8RCQ8_9PSED